MLTIKKRLVDPGIVVLEISGTLTLGRDCQQVEWQLADLLRDNQTKVVFDLTGLTQLDSTGIGIVVMCSGRLQKAGGELRIAGATGMVENVLKMTSVDHIVKMYPTAAAAKENFVTPS